jgi:hypothetical protein
MTENPRTPDLNAAAEEQLAALADMVETTFAGLARSLSDELARASSDGRASIGDLADGIIEDLARIAAERLVHDPLQQAFGDAAAGVTGRLSETLLKRSLRNG